MCLGRAVFGGYNALKRGGQSIYVSYMSVGKGRDMGLDSILGFEGKVRPGGAGLHVLVDLQRMPQWIRLSRQA